LTVLINKMDDLQVQAEKIVEKMRAGDSFSHWLRLEIVELRQGYCSAKMIIRKDMLNGHNVCHGGIPFSLADSALAFAANTQGRIALSIDASMSYPEKILEGDTITATARELSSGNRIAMYDVTIKNQDDVTVGLFRGTVYKLDVKHFD